MADIWREAPESICMQTQPEESTNQIYQSLRLTSLRETQVIPKLLYIIVSYGLWWFYFPIGGLTAYLPKLYAGEY